MEFIRSIIPYVSYLWIAIVAVIIWAWVYINKLKNNSSLLANRHRIEMIPSAVSTLGVLGTFLGITLGLLCFNTKNLTTSIPDLLEGLKTAFFTSLAGMIGSLVLSKRINNLYDKETGGVSDANQAASIICKSVTDLHEEMNKHFQIQADFYKTEFRGIAYAIIENMDKNASKVCSCIERARENIEDDLKYLGKQTSLLDNVVNHTSSIASNVEEIKVSSGNVDGTTSSIVTSVGNIEETFKSQEKTTERINSSLSEVLDHTEAMVSTEGEISEKVTQLQDKLHGEVVDIEDKMEETSKLLELKFNEFSELLKKNNTEALVEVMKRVTEEFQKQMNALINKLVKENFEQLNKSVERLNQWQIENKEMIKSLTTQYKEMATNFENTSESLNRVKDDTQSLVSEGGRLDQLVNSLNEVIVHDQKFKEISTNLQKTADLSKTNMESFDQSTRQLNEWVKKQRNFTDSVAVLIKKLEELNEMKDYASTFWKDTKKGMNDAVGIVKNGTEQLNRQITGLDQHFYSRLSTTLANLDACIQALISNTNERNRR